MAESEQITYHDNTSQSWNFVKNWAQNDPYPYSIRQKIYKSAFCDGPDKQLWKEFPKIPYLKKIFFL